MIYYDYNINYGEIHFKSNLCLILQGSTWCFFSEWSCKQSIWVHVEPPLTRSNFDPGSEVLSKGMAGAAGLAAAVPILHNDRATGMFYIYMLFSLSHRLVGWYSGLVPKSRFDWWCGVAQNSSNLKPIQWNTEMICHFPLAMEPSILWWISHTAFNADRTLAQIHPSLWEPFQDDEPAEIRKAGPSDEKAPCYGCTPGQDDRTFACFSNQEVPMKRWYIHA